MQKFSSLFKNSFAIKSQSNKTSHLSPHSSNLFSEIYIQRNYFFYHFLSSYQTVLQNLEMELDK